MMVQKYERMRHIKTGRFGLTLLVKASGRLFAMKTIDVGCLGTRSRAEIVQEVSEFALLRHPHLLPMRECFLEGGMLCIVSDYMDGGDVAGCIEKARRSGAGLQEACVLQWFAQAALALGYLHEQGALHCDLRARRLLLTAQGHAVLSGTGIFMRLTRSLAPEQPDLEAIHYLAPELTAGLCKHSRASDAWALGIVLYELLVLRPPFQSEHPRLLAEQIRAGPVPPLPATCPAELRQLCGALLRREPARRLSPAEALQEPPVQQRLLSLLSEDAGPLPEHCRAGPISPRAAAASCGAPARRHPAPRGGAPHGGLCGPLVLGTPLATPRGLRRVGERCLLQGGGGGRELRDPPSVWKRRGGGEPAGAIGHGAAQPAQAASDVVARLVTSASQPPSTAGAGELATGLVTELLDDMSLSGTHLLDADHLDVSSSGPLGASGSGGLAAGAATVNAGGAAASPAS